MPVTKDGKVWLVIRYNELKDSSIEISTFDAALDCWDDTKITPINVLRIMRLGQGVCWLLGLFGKLV